MKDNKKTYWKGAEQLTNDPEFVKKAEREFPEYLPIGNGEGNGSSRRDFLKMMGFGIAAASLAACEAPVRKAIPYLNKPMDVDPGVANYYASTYHNGGDFCSIVVKTREGRPIKIEGNEVSSITEGATNAQVQASVLSLYDQERLIGPKKGGKNITWDALDKEVIAKLDEIAANGGEIRIVSNTISSPTTLSAIDSFLTKYPTAKHVTYDSDSFSGMRKANEMAFGEAFIPSYDFSKAKTIVSFDADFLGTWLSPIEFTKQFSKTRKITKEKPEMSRLYAFEANMSLTGANADYRTAIRPSQQGLAVATLYNMIAAKAGAPTVSVPKVNAAYLDKAAKDLWKAKGASLVVAGANDPYVQLMVNAINNLLGSYGSTIDTTVPVNYRHGDDAAMNTFISDLKGGKVQGVLFYNANPVYNHPKGADIAANLKKASLTLSTSDRMDETASNVTYVAPDHHFLESWGDVNPKKGYYSLIQPTITPLFKTRQAPQSMLTWSGQKVNDYFEYVKAYWKKNFYKSQEPTFQRFWDRALFNGVYEEKPAADATQMTFNGDVASAASKVASTYKAGNKNLEVQLYQKIAIGDGTHANNPWLQEMPDPISKAVWDNYVTMSQKMANDLGVKTFEETTSIVKFKIAGKEMQLPALIQPGQAEGTIGIALGYGRTKAGKVANGVGLDMTPFLAEKDGTIRTALFSGVSVDAVAGKGELAKTQTHETYMAREAIIQEATLSEYKKNPWAGRFVPEIETYQGKKKPSKITLWQGHKYDNHHWGLAIDLNSCTGCGACTIACQSENNVAVVGKQEVINRREMHWIRIDRYYSSDAPVTDIVGLEKASRNPEVTFQPMMCQHCNNAPCETVCPVAATTHSTEGLNMMTYNRCVGTRYCANNCPYKVRRFNWFKYHDNSKFDKNSAMNNNLGKMALNPDVTVRSRGVMEKCSMCVQRIQAGKLKAKKEKRRLTDKDVNMACAAACPTNAILFGDMNNKDSEIFKRLKIQEVNDKPIKEVNEERAYHALEEIRVAPNVWYFTKIRNKDKQDHNA